MVLYYQHQVTLNHEMHLQLYELKQFMRMWYTRLSEYLIGKEYFKNDELCPCVFILENKFQIFEVVLYVDVMNIIGTLDEIRETTSYLKSEFERKDLGKTWFCLDILSKTPSLWNINPPIRICLENDQAI